MRDRLKLNLYEFAKTVLDIDLTPSKAHQCFLDLIERLNAKYGTGNWKLCFGRRGNPVIITKQKAGITEWL